MAEEQTPGTAAPAEAAPEKKAKGSNKLVLPLIVALATVGGGVVGLKVVGPMFVAKRVAAEHVSEGLEPAEDEGHGESAARGPMFKVDNLIVNPAGSQGTRFLMVSVAVETPDAHTEEQLRRQEPRIRDVIISMLERQTMESLSEIGIRDTIKARLSDTLVVITGGPRLRVFLPQFVIQ
ncbi:MAG: flagellar basal body-associated protein FliL [Gemmatimonadales bacterium]